MAINKEKFFEIINKVRESEDLNEDNLLKKIGNELKAVNSGVYSTYENLKIGKIFSVLDSGKIVNCTLLHLAVECNNIPIVKFLLAKGLEIDKPIYELDGARSKLTALHIAALHGHQEIIQLLLDANANPLLENNEGKTPRGMVDNVPNIVEMLKEGEQRYITSQFEVRAARKQTYRGSNNKISEDYKNNEQTSPNSIANTNKGDDTLEIEQALRERDAMEKQLREREQQLANKQRCVEQKYLYNQHPEQHTVHNEEQISLDLTTDGSSNNDSGVGTPLEEEISLENVNAFDEDALHHAATDNDKELVKHLIESGTNVNVQDENGYTSLHRAAAEGHIEAVQHLIKGGANINVQDKNGRASLHYAVMYNNKELVKLLIKCRANVEVADKDGLTPLHYAAADNCLEIGLYLIKNQANVNTQDRAEHTPLYYAVANDNKKLAKYLIKHGADRSLIKDEDLIGRLDSYADFHSQKNDVMRAQEETKKAKKPRVKLKKSCAQFESKQKELKQQIQELENRNTKLTETHKVLLEKAQKELAELNNYVAGHETRLHKLNEEGESLRRKMQDLKNENITLREKTKNQYSETHRVLLEKAQKELVELNNHVAGHETRLEALNKLDEENRSLREKIKELQNKNTTLSSKLNKATTSGVPLEKAELCFFKVASVNFVTTLVIFSIASGLSALSMIAISVVSALIASGVTYAISKPTTELKDADISRVLENSICKV